MRNLLRWGARPRARTATLTRINLFDGRRKESLSNYAGRRCPTGTLMQQKIPGDQR
jgi:hypothetical protein